MKKHSTLLKVLFLFLSLTFAYQGYAQGVRITGKVTDANDGKTMPGVTIAVKNTTTGTITDIDGNFTLNVNKGAALVFSFIGYNTQEVVIADQVTLKIVMVPSVTTLEEAVVIGYGTVKKVTQQVLLLSFRRRTSTGEPLRHHRNCLLVNQQGSSSLQAMEPPAPVLPSVSGEVPH